MTKDEARKIAAGIAKLPDLLKRAAVLTRQSPRPNDASPGKGRKPGLAGLGGASGQKRLLE
jgi:hypothetical protein